MNTHHDFGSAHAYYYGVGDNEAFVTGPGWSFTDEGEELFFVSLPITTPRAVLQAVYDAWTDGWEQGHSAARRERA